MQAAERDLYWSWMWRAELQRPEARPRLVPIGLAWLAAFGAGGYGAVAHVAEALGPCGWTPALALDRAIPAWPWTLPLYLSFYGIFVVAAELARRGSDSLRREWMLLCQATWLAMALSYAIFLVAPCEVAGRDAMRSVGGGWQWLVRVVHGFDPPYNAWPSLHISLSLLQVLWVDRVLRRDASAGTDRDANDGRPWPLARLALWTWWWALAASVLTTKQHYLFDVVSGACLALVLWRVPFLSGVATLATVGIRTPTADRSRPGSPPAAS